MQPPSPAIRRQSLQWAVGAALAVVLLVSGLAWASLSTYAAPLVANGNLQQDTSLNYWTETTIASTIIPTTLPIAVSTTAGTPTSLKAMSTSYEFNSGAVVSGHPAVEFTFTEQTNATKNTEIEIRFTVGTQTGSTIPVTIYIETQSSIPASPTLYNFYYDLGTAAASTQVIVDTADQASLVCSAVGTCP